MSENKSALQGVKRYRVWDLPIRLFHWLLVLGIFGAWLSLELGNIKWHMNIGVAVGGLILFRLLWGLWGSETARFTQFIRGPKSVWRYITGQEKSMRLGHNPMGALSVIALLGLVGLQVGTGLFANDDVFSSGPFRSWVSGSTSDWLTDIHELNFNLLLVFIGLHLAAVFVHVVIKKHDLLRAMITGVMRIPARIRVLNPEIKFAPWWLFLITAIIVAGVAWWISTMISTL